MSKASERKNVEQEEQDAEIVFQGERKAEFARAFDGLKAEVNGLTAGVILEADALARVKACIGALDAAVA